MIPWQDCRGAGHPGVGVLGSLRAHLQDLEMNETKHIEYQEVSCFQGWQCQEKGVAVVSGSDVGSTKFTNRRNVNKCETVTKQIMETNKMI